MDKISITKLQQALPLALPAFILPHTPVALVHRAE
jgi:hypothetical protein